MSSDKPNDLKLNIKPWTLGVWGFLFALLIFIRKKLYFIMNVNRIITEAIDNILSERMDAEKIASYTLKLLDENGVGINEFINALGKQLSFDLGDNPFMNQGNQKMKLVNAIKTSKTFYDTTGSFYGYESGDAELIKPIIIMGAKVYRIGYGIMDEKDMEKCGDTEPIYFYGCSEQWDRSGEGRLTITNYIANQIENIIKNIKR